MSMHITHHASYCNPLELTHQSPEITRVHSQEYLQWLKKQADNPSRKYASHTHEQLASELQSVRTTLKTTRDIIKAKEYGITLPTFAVSFGDSNSFAGNRRQLQDNYHRGCYATIPIAAAYALQTNLFKRILIIDENLDVVDNADIDDLEEYYKYGNGALLYSPHNEQTSSIFKDKVINYDNVNYTVLWNFLNNEGQNIDLVFYNIGIHKGKYTDQRKLNIFSLFQKLIPVVFIIPDHKWYDKKLDYILTYITMTASKMSTLFASKLETSDYKLRPIYKIYNDNWITEEMCYTSNSESEDSSETDFDRASESESNDNDYDNALSHFYSSESDDDSDDDIDNIMAKYKENSDEKGIACKNKFYM